MRFLFVLLFIPFSWGQTSIQQVLNAFVNDPVNRHAKISFEAIDLSSGETIASFHPTQALPPASTTKLFSTSTAIQLLGPDHRMSTKIYCDGFIDEDSVLHGNIWIRGGGDVSLGSKFFCFENQELTFLQDWTDSLKLLGVKFIEGSIIADGSEFGYEGTPPSWGDGDVGNYYGAFAGGLNFYDNTVKFKFRTGAKGSKAIFLGMYPEVPGFHLGNEVLASTVSGDETIVYGDAFEMNRTIKGYLPSNQSMFIVKGSMPDPELQLAIEWRKVLLLNGIQVEDDVKSFRLNHKELHENTYQNKTLLFQVYSKSVQEIAYWTNLKSVNLFADGLLQAMAYHQTGNGRMDEALKIQQEYWKNRISTHELMLHDGCGLSRENQISASHFCSLLKYMYTSPYFSNFKSTLPIAGVSGTSKYLCKGEPGEGRVFAKSGSMKGIKSYAGYIDSSSGRQIAFSITVNDFSCSGNQLSVKIEKILNALSVY